MRSDISVCIATCLRPRQLERLLADLRIQTLAPAEIIVVDNDAAGSACDVAEAARQSGQPVRYDIQPVRNIALTRNRTVELASGEWLAFIDDDERAPPQWLEQLYTSAMIHRAGIVLGPVLPGVPEQAPAWIRRGNFYDWARMQSGSQVPLNRLRFGNVLMKAALLENAVPFDPAYGLTGGEDGELLTRLARLTPVIWSDEAVVHEPVEPARLSLRWLLRRSLRGGQDYARHALAGRYGPATPLRRLLLILRAATQFLIAGLLALLCLPAGRHYAACWLTRASANFGKLSVFWGWHYREYA